MYDRQTKQLLDVGSSDATVIVKFKVGVFVVSSCSC
jgi:hypothetical protein